MYGDKPPNGLRFTCAAERRQVQARVGRHFAEKTLILLTNVSLFVSKGCY
ncbi:MAG: hypothetical protein KatS3mg100_745 [Candidatus Parcubacteria bacterium]|nr:MAG: hypothetical protein KatS3mg100_745 [Candidatus Parcubacteria bacterium]